MWVCSEEHPNYQILDDALSPSLYDARYVGWCSRLAGSTGTVLIAMVPSSSGGVRFDNDVEPHIALKELEPWLKSTIAAGYRIQRIYANGQTAFGWTYPSRL